MATKRFLTAQLRVFLAIAVVFSLMLGSGGVVFAANPPPVQLFYVTLPEADALKVNQSINTSTNGVSIPWSYAPVYTYFSISVAVADTYVYYDQWENGYAADIANPTPAEIYNSVTNPGGVQIWGNGIAADGCAPNIRGVPVVCTDANDVLAAGDVIIPYNAVPLTGNDAYYVLDTFSTAEYDNQNGNVTWSTNWVETGDDGSASSGDIRITSGQLRFVETADSGDRITRGVNIPVGACGATLTFALGQSGIDSGSDNLSVRVSANGGTTWVTLATYTSAAAAGAKSIDISAYATPNTRVQFIMDGYSLESGEYWSMDDVRVTWGDCGRNTSVILFDAGDKVGATHSIAMARTTWTSGSDTLLAFAHEMYATSEWGTAYEAPVGTNTPYPEQGYTDQGMFEYAALTIMAGQNDTTVQIDKDANGIYETTITLNEGHAALVEGIGQGARVQSDKPVQVVLLTGDIGSTYESRDMNLLPVSAYGTSYWAPVGVHTEISANAGPTRLFLYNPSGNSAMTFTCTTSAGSTTSGSIAAGGVWTFNLSDNQAAHCTASQPFFGVATIDTAVSGDPTYGSSAGQAWDWSYTLYPDAFLTTEALVGLGLGRDPNSGTNPSENGSPLWVTAACEGGTWVYVDWNNDGTADPVDTDGDGVAEAGSENGTFVNHLQSVRLFNSSQGVIPYSQSGARVWSRTASDVGYGGTPGCKLALAWGQDPRRATAGAPGLDVGTSVPPLRLVEGTKSMEIAIDTAPEGLLSPGDTIYYNITIKNAGPSELLYVRVYDQVPAHTTYVVETTEYKLNVGGTWTSIPDDGGGTPFPLDVEGGVSLGRLQLGQTFYVRFRVTLNQLGGGDYSDITNCETVFTDAGTYGTCVTNQVASRDWGDLPDSYGTAAAADGPNHSWSGLKLGLLWDVEVQGQANVSATGDDQAYLDDEDGVTRLAGQTWIPGGAVNLNVTVTGGPGVLGGWFDWNNDGDIADPGEFVNFGTLPDGLNVVNLDIPSTWNATPLYARFRLFDPNEIPGDSLDAGDYLGFAVGGEVEDYYWTFLYDWGDLPDSYGTTLASDGPHHNDSGLYLGVVWDSEFDGQPTVNADGDDLNPIAGPDDEDGVTLAGTYVGWEAGNGMFSVRVNGGPGCVNAWMDFTNDTGSGAGQAFADGNFTKDDGYDTYETESEIFSEHIVQNLLLGTGKTLIDVTVPPGLNYGTQTYYLRFRISPPDGNGQCTADIAPTGFVAGGEVEDYRITLSGDPTSVGILPLRAMAVDSSVVLMWETANEFDNLGFNVYRATSPEGARVRLNAELIPSLVPPGSPFGAAYEYVDSAVKVGGTYYYWLEKVDIHGRTDLLGPVDISLSDLRGKPLPPLLPFGPGSH
jgi:uncharacterized repeat protein (TIGR01451 family)